MGSSSEMTASHLPREHGLENNIRTPRARLCIRDSPSCHFECWAWLFDLQKTGQWRAQLISHAEPYHGRDIQEEQLMWSSVFVVGRNAQI